MAVRIARAAVPIADPAWGRLLADVRRQMGVARRVALRMSPDVTVPITFGWRRPVVLVPPSHATWSVERRRAVLSHEMAHVRRHDWPLQLIDRVVSALYWFLPPIRWATARRRIEAERACDEMVIAHGVARVAYARSLVAVADASGPPRHGTTALVGGTGELEERVRAILRPALPGPRRRSSIAAAGLVLAGGVTLVISAPGPVCPFVMKAAGMTSALDGIAIAATRSQSDALFGDR